MTEEQLYASLLHEAGVAQQALADTGTQGPAQEGAGQQSGKRHRFVFSDGDQVSFTAADGSVMSGSVRGAETGGDYVVIVGGTPHKVLKSELFAPSS